jgi:hypothetical protein
MKTGPKPKGELVRFEESYIPEPNSGCWLWIKGISPGGYGVIRQDGVRKQIGAHRFAYLRFRGPIPANMCACHRCDNRLCVNPDHLFLGTRKENMQDMYRKGRSYDRRGEGNNRAKLTAAQVIAIRNDPREGAPIAAEYGIHRLSVYAIKNRKKWSHI